MKPVVLTAFQKSELTCEFRADRAAKRFIEAAERTLGPRTVELIETKQGRVKYFTLNEIVL